MKKFPAAPQRTLLCLAITAIFPVPAAADDDVERLTKPDSSIVIGIGTVNTDNQRYGTYNGTAKAGEHLIGEASVVRFDDTSGTWLRFSARDFGLPTREFRIEHEKQGDWSYFLDYTQIPRYAPYDVFTAVSPNGGQNLTVPNAGGVKTTAGESEIKTERDKTTLGFVKAITHQLEFRVNFQNEEKKGSRLFGRGSSAGAGAWEFLPEPINSTTRQLDLDLNYLGERLQLSGGYYGSFYNNHNSALTISGGSAGFAGTNLNNPIALPPDNLAHQLKLAGAYDFTRTTRGTFKASYAVNTQNDKFILPPTAAVAPVGTTNTNDSGRSDLGGRVETTLLQLGLTSRPVKGLSLLANLRHEDSDDETTIAQYIPASASSDGRNERRSLRSTSGKFEASYLLPAGFRATGGVDYERKLRSKEGIRVVGYRENTAETTYRAELGRALADDLSGSVSYLVANRNGGYFPVNATSNLVNPIYIADRDRNKVKILANWAPIDPLSLQFMLDDSRDRYDGGRGSPEVGVRAGDAQLYSIDASYSLGSNWTLTGYAAQFTTRVNQASGRNTATYYEAALKNTGINYGFGVKGKLGAKFRIGADLLWAEDLNTYGLSGAATPLPDINSSQTTLKLFGTYAYDKDTSIRLDYIYDHRKTNDWTWNGAGKPYVFTDGTWLYQNPDEKVQFIGLSVNYGFR
ncbi:MAG: hypothetical protein A3H93_11640 [Rhodocyclales bacterium RIFCSPLOWO2_02_FULL_63_24]|nr:MAG: hypothetical protein A3H93_11640 [Rhodocyclales bacterium RIFCSPLOWO2_02_FULL_63_24]